MLLFYHKMVGSRTRAVHFADRSEAFAFLDATIVGGFPFSDW
jgi:hypothetical protein